MLLGFNLATERPNAHLSDGAASALIAAVTVAGPLSEVLHVGGMPQCMHVGTAQGPNS